MTTELPHSTPTERQGRDGNGRSILVLGMHRSGTSALTRVLNLLGADLGSELLRPGFSNEKGFWEHRAAYEHNDRLLLGLNRSWDDVRPLPDAWLERPIARDIRAQLVDEMRADFASSGLWAVKDPRLCRLVPLWSSIVTEIGASPVAVLVIRHPAEVARSLMARNEMSFEHGCLLWAMYMLEAERDTRAMPRCAVTYDQLLGDWSSVAERIRQELGVPLQVSESRVAQVDGYLDRGERHHRADDAEDTLPSWVERLYRCFNEVAAGRGGWDAVEEAGREAVSISRHFASYTERLIVGVDMVDRHRDRLMKPNLEELLRQWAEESVHERAAARQLMLQRISDLEGAVFEREARLRDAKHDVDVARLEFQSRALQFEERDRAAEESRRDAQATIELLQKQASDGEALCTKLQSDLDSAAQELVQLREALQAAEARRAEAERRAVAMHAEADAHLDLLMMAKDLHAREVEAIKLEFEAMRGSATPAPLYRLFRAVTGKGTAK